MLALDTFDSCHTLNSQFITALRVINLKPRTSHSIIVAAQCAHLRAMKKSTGNEDDGHEKIDEQWRSTRAQNSTTEVSSSRLYVWVSARRRSRRCSPTDVILSCKPWDYFTSSITLVIM